MQIERRQRVHRLGRQRRIGSGLQRQEVETDLSRSKAVLQFGILIRLGAHAHLEGCRNG
jgi:hypothetical protein